ncbi:FHA domain-containing protein [Varibaculum prostatecancerukia]|uniref:FHA domain-containing protein n=1 Tax=Varibaculum prostatecancerukia TaxID=2811781 RepID=UPI001C003AA9|nr:FHA domain-containing protein [Varibaculum prostatecancerukia]
MSNDPYQYYPNQSGSASAGYPPSGIYGAPQAEPGAPVPGNPDPYGQGANPAYPNPYGEQPQAPQYPGYSPQGAPGYQQPEYGQPEYQQPEYGQPAYQQPPYAEPGYQQPAYEQPQYQQQYGQADYGQGQYEMQPQYEEQPAYQPAMRYTVTSGQGQSMILEDAIVVGRRPDAATSTYPQAQTMTVPSPAKQISRTHCLLYIDEHGNPSLKDLESVNGTRLRRDGQVYPIEPADPVVLQAGDIVDLGEGQYLSIGTAPAGY